jgi:glycosyltransferase involved in cell wall biosynthesis
MKVAHVHRMRGIGGSERHVLTLLPALRELGVEPRFVGLDDRAWEPSDFYGELEASAVPFTRLRSPAGLRRALRGADLVHTHLVHADVFGALAAGRRPVVSTKHNDDRFRLGPFRHVERALARRTARIVCITEALRRFTVERVGLPAGKVTVIHYGLDDLPRPWATNPPSPVPAGARVLLSVSRLTEQKGLDTAVRALAGLSPDTVLVVLGEGPLRGPLTALARELGVDRRLFLLGRVGDVAEWYRRADLLVHPARWEGFGLALLEGMLAGLPVVATSVSSIPEIVADGETGLLVDPGEASALAAAIERLLGDDELRRRYGEAGLARARGDFSVGRMARATAEVYESASR